MSNRATSQLSDGAILGFGLVGLAVLSTVGAYAGVHVSAWVTGTPSNPAANPVELVSDLINGRTEWTTPATITVSVLVGLPLIGLFVFAALGAPGSSVDRQAVHLATKSQIAHLRRQGVARTAKRLGVPEVVRHTAPGLEIGPAVRLRSSVYSSWEDMLLLIAGPRTLKTTGYAIPAVLQAPGAVLATSNKRDLVDDTRAVRAEAGQVWVFDPQGVAGEPVTWWWNPLTYIAAIDPATGRSVRDVYGNVAARFDRAEKLAAQFATSSKPSGAREDAYFEPESVNLIALLLLAAACAQVPITSIYGWLSDPKAEEPLDALEGASFISHARSLAALQQLPAKQRDGVYGTSRARMGFLRHDNLTEWITPPTARPRTATSVWDVAPMDRQFHPHTYATSTDTLYLLSRDGEGSAGPLVAALTLAVLEALEAVSIESPGGRLETPFLGVLDEAANICRVKNLDSYYSHYGSRGIILLTILQSWAQGEEVWGKVGMTKLWSAATIKIYGGGVDDSTFLRQLSDLCGSYDHRTSSRSTGRSGTTRSTQTTQRPILSVDQLRGLRGRAVVLASGTPPLLITPQRWFTTDLKKKVAAAQTRSEQVHTDSATGSGESQGSVVVGLDESHERWSRR